MGKQRTEFFPWCGDERSKIFPIDFTLQELAAQLDPAGSRRAPTGPLIKIVDGVHLRPALQEMKLSDKSEAGAFPIPLETIPFFSCLKELAQSEQYKKAIANNFSNEPDLQTQFIDEVCLMLYKETLIAEETVNPYIDTSFSHHVLFQDERFIESLIADLWKNEISTRFESLQLLAKKRQLGSQLRAFVDCLMSLDRCILNLKIQHESTLLESDLTSRKTTELEKILQLLVSARIPIRANGEIRSYHVKNIMVDERPMEAVFNQLQRPPSKPDLLRLARKCYLEDIANDFETREDKAAKEALETARLYTDVRHYLKITSGSVGKTELRAIIAERCTYQCTLIIDYCNFDGSVKTPPVLPSSDYTAFLLDQLIQIKMNSSLHQFQETIQLVSFYSAAAFGSFRQHSYCEVRLESYLQMSNLQPPMPISKALDSPMHVQACKENPYYDEIYNFLTYFERAWAFLHSVDLVSVNIFDRENHVFFNKDCLAAELFSIGIAAASEFKREELAFKSVQETLNCLNEYEILICHLTNIYPTYRYYQILSKLLLVILMAVLHKIAKAAEDTMVSELTLLPGVDD